MEGNTKASQHDLAFNERLKGAYAAKEDGTTALNAGKLREAIFYYKKGCMYLGEYISITQRRCSDAFVDMLVDRQNVHTRPSLSAERLKEVNNLYVALRNNMAHVSLKMDRYSDAVEFATMVLSISGYEKNTKALLRRAKGLAYMGDLEGAEKDLNSLECYAAEGSTGVDPMVGDLRRFVAKKRRDDDRKDQEMCRKMFKS
ncbi:hypothetical protein ERJ75_001753600 [Trypanosoma vivax]|uniref:Uncharacterized protein n=1 Tax=Trypanosoma vivax (strain Y486) TaxID=1055687 RepID=G0U2F2_TRYVY|nr:hypothetical protein ERJ75_001753600 [Trypanosoma vivax]CCC50455.1 conserved hypothetical protein [Trypanosoma vivax Y486]